VLSMGAFGYTLGLVVVEPLAGALTTTTGLLNLGLFLGIVTFFPCAYILARWRTTVAAWPAVTPLPSRLIAGHRVSRFHRLLERARCRSSWNPGLGTPQSRSTSPAPAAIAARRRPRPRSSRSVRTQPGIGDGIDNRPGCSRDPAARPSGSRGPLSSVGPDSAR